MDSDGDGISDATEGTSDTDSDGTPNFLDTDSDGDGISDATETTVDTDSDGTPNYLDTDSDDDGLLDGVDQCRLVPGTANGCPDADGDGVRDAFDNCLNTPNAAQADSDFDGFGDACDATPLGDLVPGDNLLDTVDGTFFSFDFFPIPAGFFGAGSQLFEGEIQLRGLDLDPPTQGTTDTIVERGSGNFGEPSGPAFVEIEIVELSLVGTEPISVDVDGLPTQWIVEVSLGQFPSMGFLIVDQDETDGDTFDSFIPVQPVFTFTKVGDPSDVRTLDTLPPIFLDGQLDPWVFNCGPEALPGAATGNFCPDDFAPGLNVFTWTDFNGTFVWNLRVAAPDADSDGFAPVDGDCDDTNAAVNPDATEVVNGIDDNCDGQVDEGAETFYPDTDGDLFGDPDFALVSIGQPIGFVLNNTDCDDTNANVNPGATEVVNGIDDNCDGQVDEGAETFYPDTDGDLFGDPDFALVSIGQPIGFVSDNTDCDDSNAAVNPGATEVVNGIDDNCDGQVDEGAETYFLDFDSDLFGDPDFALVSIGQPTGFVSDNTDCDDSNAAVNPGATEVVNGIDDNCDGQIDEGAAVAGFMTGGGHARIGKGRTAHHYSWGFSVQCDGSQGSLQFNDHRFGGKFHLESLTSVACLDDPFIEAGQPSAGFDTISLVGQGRWNGDSGATIFAEFTDAGEPGGSDSVRLQILNADGEVIYDEKVLAGGNNQAHDS